MSLYQRICAGTRARKTITLTIKGVEVRVDVRVLDVGREERPALAAARAVATAELKRQAEAVGLTLADMPELKTGNAEYDLAVMAQIVLRAATDPDSPEKAPEPYFDSLAQVDTLDRDELTLLYEQQVAWQQECSPRHTKLSPGQVAATLLHLIKEEGEGGPDANFIESLPRATLLQSLRFLAKMLSTVPTSSSPSSTVSPSSGTSASSHEESL